MNMFLPKSKRDGGEEGIERKSRGERDEAEREKVEGKAVVEKREICA